jgi:hypothetical protein
MTRLSKTQYTRRLFVTASVYVVLVIALLPLARNADVMALRLVYSLLPTLPLLYVVWLTGRRIWQSDELEQRTHLIGLGVASAVVGVFSLIGGFLAVTKAVSSDAAPALLLWVFPLMMFSYGLAHGLAVRQYGGSICDEAEAQGMPPHIQFLLVMLIFGGIALWAYFRVPDKFVVGLFCSIAVTFGVVALVFGLRHRRRQRNDAANG